MHNRFSVLFFFFMPTTRQLATTNLNIDKAVKIVIIDGLMILNKYLINQIFQRTDTKTAHTHTHTRNNRRAQKKMVQ